MSQAEIYALFWANQSFLRRVGRWRVIRHYTSALFSTKLLPSAEMCFSCLSSKTHCKLLFFYSTEAWPKLSPLCPDADWWSGVLCSAENDSDGGFSRRICRNSDSESVIQLPSGVIVRVMGASFLQGASKKYHKFLISISNPITKK